MNFVDALLVSAAFVSPPSTATATDDGCVKEAGVRERQRVGDAGNAALEVAGDGDKRMATSPSLHLNSGDSAISLSGDRRRGVNIALFRAEAPPRVAAIRKGFGGFWPIDNQDHRHETLRFLPPLIRCGMVWRCVDGEALLHAVERPRASQLPGQ